jgi:hypothetical protein
MSLTLRSLVATLIKNPVPPLRGSTSFLTVSQGSASLHPGLTSGRAYGAWFIGLRSIFSTLK